MGCKKDDTCDQPATQGQIETLQATLVITLMWVLGNHLMWYAKKR